MTIDGTRGPTPPPDDDDDDATNGPDTPREPISEGTVQGEAERPPLRKIAVSMIDGIRIETSAGGIVIAFETRGERGMPDVEITFRADPKHLEALQGLLKNADFKTKEEIVYTARFPRPLDTQLELGLG